MSDSTADVPAPALPGLRVYPRSRVDRDGAVYGLADLENGERRLAVLAPAESWAFAGLEGEQRAAREQTLLLAPLSSGNAAVLRDRFAWLCPSVMGLRTTVGLGDRLGLATPGHLRAVRAVGGDLWPFPAQQSIREMQRTGRSAQQVMDDAMWGVFEEGWRTGFGADADHLKTHADIDRCLAAGYTFYTVDPGDHVDNTVESQSVETLRARLDTLPWDTLEDSSQALGARYLAAAIVCEDRAIAFTEQTLLRAALKYGPAVAHAVSMYRHLAGAAAGRPFEVEVSVDETEAPTNHAEHVYIAGELKRLGVQWVSLAPRFIGRFEKGVDYIGDLDAFVADFAVHAAIARTLGPYKLSLHSGSDKFSIYAVSAELTGGVVPLKTAGTSYLEALRTIAAIEPTMLREIYIFARRRYETDRASYHVSAQLERAPLPESVSDAALPALLDQFDAREILHVTFGSVLTEQAGGSFRFHDRLMALLRAYSEAYAANIEAHFTRHLRPFAEVNKTRSRDHAGS